jgi:hypothetical protein
MKYKIMRFCQTVGGDIDTEELCEHESGMIEYRQDFARFCWTELNYSSVEDAILKLCDHSKVDRSTVKTILMVDNNFPKPLPYIKVAESDGYAVGFIYPTEYAGFYT